MSQPRRTPGGYLRRMQMSRHGIFTFVEGKEADGFFVGGLCNRAFRTMAMSYRVCTASELSYASGGKDVLIKFYHYLRSRRSLATTLNGKKTYAVFFIDKDVDDFMRAKCRSRNVVYTTSYDVHNHLFLSGDFARSVACACSVPQETVGAHPRFAQNWCSDAAARWRVWATLCMFCQLHGIRYPNYRVASQVNSPENGQLDRARYRQTVGEMYRRTGWTWPEFSSKLRATRRVVKTLYAKGEADRVFKGKWYPHILELDLRSDGQFLNSQLDGFAKRIPSCLASTLDFNADWACGFVEALQRAVN